MPKLEAYDKSLPYSYALGIYPCHALLDARPDAARRLLIDESAAQGEGIERLCARCGALGIRYEAAARVLRRESRKHNCYAALVFDKFQDVLSADAPHVVLHELSDAGNLGTILRTCLGFGVKDVALIHPAADHFEPHVIRASMGAAFAMRVAAFETFEDYLGAYPGHALYPFMLDSATPLHEAAPNASTPYALVFGNEGRGLPPDFAQLGQSVVIPHCGAIDSLNVAVAVGIGVYAFANCGFNRGNCHTSETRAREEI